MLGAKRPRRWLSFGAAVLLGTAVLVTSPSGASAQGAEVNGGEQRVIVELDGTPVLRAPADRLTAGELRARRSAIEDRHARLADLAAGRGIDLTVAHSYSLTLDGLAGTVAAEDAAALAALPGVVAVHEDRPVQASTADSVPLVGAPEVWERVDPGGSPVRGDGVTVAVVDTGIDYTHPDLGGGFGPGSKVVAGHDFVNDDGDPMDDNGHGTHVAGIVAGDGSESVTGVAPGAQLTAYKVLNRRGSGRESWIIAGIEAAADPENPHRADVINLSLGGPGDGTDPLGRAATAAAEAGVVVVAAAGNDGPGTGTVATPASADGVLAVGATASGLRLPTARLAQPEPGPLSTYRVPFSANPPEAPFTAEIVDVGLGRPEDYQGVDVTGKIVVYRGGVPSRADQVSVADIAKAREAEQRGAVAVLGYLPTGLGSPDEQRARARARERERRAEVPARPGPADSGDDLRMDRVVVLGMDGWQYTELAAHLPDGPVLVTIEGTDVTDRVASFSSRGPTGRFGLKPEIVAPGVEIRSTSLTTRADPYLRISGTSMAAPHVAGAAALLRQLHPADESAQIGAALIGSAEALAHSGPTTVGAGRLDVRAAADAVVTASPAVRSLGLADLSRESVAASAPVRLHNRSGDAVSADLGTVAAPGSLGAATVTPEQVTIPAGGSVTVTVRVSGPRPAADAQLAGWVVAAVDGAPDLRVPYHLSVRPLIVRASPNPSDGTTTAFIFTPAPLDAPPVVTMTPPDGAPVEVTARHDHGSWYRADLASDEVGVHRLSAAAQTSQGQRLIGTGAFEVVPPEFRPGRSRWEPIGPNSQAGQLTTGQAAPGQAAVTTFGEATVWLTDDHGRNWEQVRRLPVAGGHGVVVIDPSDGDQMWYAINSGVWDPTYVGKILRTRDRGRTWTTLDFPDVPLRALVSDPAGQVLAAVTPTAVLVSHDGGDSWTTHPASWPSGPPGLSPTLCCSAAISGGDLYVAAGNAIWVMRDVVADPAPLEVVYTSPFSLVGGVAADEEIVVTAAFDGSVVGSRDGGASWEELHQAGFLAIAYLRVSEGDIVVNTIRDSHLSRDYGQTWQQQRQPLSDPVRRTGPIVLDYDRWPGNAQTQLFSADQAGLFATDDLGESYRRRGVQSLTAYDVALAEDPRGRPVLLAGTDSGTYRTGTARLPSEPVRLRPGTAEWGLSGLEGSLGATDHLITAAPSDPRVVWRVRQNALGQFLVDRSADGGETWQRRAASSEVAGALFVHPDEPDHVAVSFWSLTRRGVIVTTDGGQTWRRFDHGMTFDTIQSDPADPGRLWLGNATGLYRSDDDGRTLTQVLEGRVSAIGTDRRAPERIVAGGDEIRISTDGGQTFHTADAGPLPMRVSDIVTSARSSRTLYAGTTSHLGNGLVQGGRGVLRSQDGGQTWVSISGGLQNLDVTRLEVGPDRRYLYAGTVGGGVHRLRP